MGLTGQGATTTMGILQGAKQGQMKTITVQIGNSDDKLSQSEWSQFTSKIMYEIEINASEIHFSGSSDPLAAWQNAAFVFCIRDYGFMGNDRFFIDNLKSVLSKIAKLYRQDSIAWTEGETEFV